MSAVAGKHAFVTGASRGIGAAIAGMLEQAGAKVTRSARHASHGVLPCDITSAEQIDAALTLAERHHGPISILINNAGIGASAKFLASNIDALDSMLDVNLKGAWRCIQRTLPAMLDAGWGRIINIASSAGLNGAPYVSAYCASKHGLVGLTRALAAEYAGQGVAIAAVCPGYTDTDMLATAVTNLSARSGISTDQAQSTIASLNPGGRILAPTEVAANVVALCSSDSGHANGRIISIPPTGPQYE